MNYILITSDSYTAGGSTKAAFDICVVRLRHGRWPLYASTSHINSIKPGDQFLVYVAGKYHSRQCFISSFKVIEIVSKKLLNIDEKILNLTNPKPVKELVFEKSEAFKAVNIKEYLDRLDHTMNRASNKWGALMMGGVKKISVDDYNLIHSNLVKN